MQYAGPRMVRCRSMDGAMQVLGCANFRDGNTVMESRSTFGINQCYRLNMWATKVFIFEGTLSLIGSGHQLFIFCYWHFRSLIQIKEGSANIRNKMHFVLLSY